jgi:hypothetical protein
MNSLSFSNSSELKPGVGKTIKIWWAYLWRYFVTAVLSIPVAAAIGYLLIPKLAEHGLQVSFIRVAGYALGAILTLLTPIIPLRLIIGKEFKGFRLALVRSSSSGKELPAAGSVGSMDQLAAAMKNIERLTK